MIRLPRWRYLIGPALVAVALAAGCQAPGASGSSGASHHLDRAQHYVERGLLNSALIEFGMALEQNPRLTEAHLGMGNIYRQRGDYELASGAYERAAAIEPNSFNAHYYLGLTRQLMGKVADAITLYLRALAIDPDNFHANQNLASAYLQLNRPTEALPYARRATRLQPNAQSAWANLAAVYSLLGEYERAVEAYREAVELGDMPDQVLLGLADAHLKLGNYQRAINVLRTLIRQSSNSTTYERLGYAQFKLRQFDKALASYRTALSLDDKDTAALNGVGVCLMTLYIQSGRALPRQKSEALQCWRRSVQLRPDQLRIIDLIARYQKI